MLIVHFGYLDIYIFGLTFQLSRKPLDKKAMVNSKTYDITDQKTNNYSTHITQYLKNSGNQAMELGQLIEHSVKNIFLQKSHRKQLEKLITDLSLFFKKALYKVKTSDQHHKKYFSCYVLLTDRILLFDSLFFLRYLCVL